MSFQSTININEALGVPGEIAFDGPIRSTPYNIYSNVASNSNPNYVGYAFTVTTGANPDGAAASANAGTAAVGGTGVFAGILVDSKQYTAFGTTGNPLGATLALPDYSIGDLLTMGEIFVSLGNAANIGDQVFYNTTTGALTSSSPSFVGTGSITTTTLTISAQATGNTGVLGVGSQVSGANVTPGTYITALGTGTGGTGTYTVTPSQTAASATVSATTLAASGTLPVPNCVVSRFAVAATGLAVIKLTN